MHEEDCWLRSTAGVSRCQRLATELETTVTRLWKLLKGWKLVAVSPRTKWVMQDQSSLEEVEVVESAEVSGGSGCECALNVAMNALLAQEQYKYLNVNTMTIDSTTTVVVCRPYYDSSLICPISNPRLCIFEKNGGFHYSFQVFFKEIDAGVCNAKFSNIECFLQQMTTTSGFVVCPGIRDYPASIRFNTKNLVVWSEPFNRRFSVNCRQWHVPNNAQQTPGSAGFDCCKPCKQLIHDIRQLQHLVRLLLELLMFLCCGCSQPKLLRQWTVWHLHSL